MLNVMEERDIQIRGYVLRLPLDVLVVATRQPRGLHQPRPHHHAAQGPVRCRDPHPLPARARRRDGGHPAGGGARRRGARLPRRDPGPVHPRAARVACGRPALRCLAPASRSPAPRPIAAAALHRATVMREDEAVARVGRPRDRRRRAGRQGRVRDRRGGTRARDPRAPAAQGDGRHRACTGSAASTSRCWSTRSPTARSSRPASGSPRSTSWPGCPVLGESDLYDEVMDRLGADARR